MVVKGIVKKAEDEKFEFFNTLRAQETLSVVYEGKFKEKPIFARIECLKGEKLEDFLVKIAEVKEALFKTVKRN